MKDGSNYQDFVAIYNEIDHFMRSTLRDSNKTEHSYLIDELSRKSAVVARHAQDLRVFAQLRNVLIHNPFMKIANPIASPAREIIEHYRHIKDAIIHPPSAISIAVPTGRLFTCELGDNALSVIEAMSANTYTHVPVVSGKGKMVGVFSENSLLSFLAHHKDAIITKEMNIAEFADFIAYEGHKGESFVFLHRNAPLNEVYELFNDAIKKRQRIGAIFITEHGAADERLLGLITAWDLALPELSQKV